MNFFIENNLNTESSIIIHNIETNIETNILTNIETYLDNYSEHNPENNSEHNNSDINDISPFLLSINLDTLEVIQGGVKVICSN
jgi:hypothetical protein